MTRYKVRCPKCGKLLAEVSGWGVTVHGKHAIARMGQGAVECRSCFRLVSFAEPTPEPGWHALER